MDFVIWRKSISNVSMSSRCYYYCCLNVRLPCSNNGLLPSSSQCTKNQKEMQEEYLSFHFLLIYGTLWFLTLLFSFSMYKHSVKASQIDFFTDVMPNKVWVKKKIQKTYYCCFININRHIVHDYCNCFLLLEASQKGPTKLKKLVSCFAKTQLLNAFFFLLKLYWLAVVKREVYWLVFLN